MDTKPRSRTRKRVSLLPAPGLGVGGAPRSSDAWPSIAAVAATVASRLPASRRTRLQIEVLILECMHELSQGRGALALAGLDVGGPERRVVHAGAGVERQQRLPERPRCRR